MDRQIGLPCRPAADRVHHRVDPDHFLARVGIVFAGARTGWLLPLPGYALNRGSAAWASDRICGGGASPVTAREGVRMLKP